MQLHASAPAQVLVVDDEPDLRTLYEMTLLREGHRVDCAGNLVQARALLAAGRYDLLITDMRLPDGLGLELLQQVQQERRPERCLVITAYGSAENAVEALKAGAFDYLTKPVDLRQFRAVVASALAGDDARRPASPGLADAGRQALERLVGTSATMQRMKERVLRVASGMAPVLVRGESGTGKELVARAIHACSHRVGGPFVAVNCGAIPEALLEAEFFGARRGSYTGATHDREGYFQAARGGTLFLDEIGDLPLAMQSKLLRAIQERQVRALGSTQEDAVDVRVVSATHKDLAAEVQAGRFRQDLYYRLNVIEIVVPPLRERREDLPALCQALLARIARDSGMAAPQVDATMLQHLQALSLPGNVRELENLLHRAVALGDGRLLALDIGTGAAPGPAPGAPGHGEASDTASMPGTPSTCEAWVAADDDAPLPADLQAWLDAQERRLLVRALRETGFNRTAAAQRLGLTLRQIRYRIARLGIQLQDAGSDEADGADRPGHDEDVHATAR